VESSFTGLVGPAVNRGMADPSLLLFCIEAIVAHQLLGDSPEESSLSLCKSKLLPGSSERKQGSITKAKLTRGARIEAGCLTII
jgi:hypothetical protein